MKYAIVYSTNTGNTKLLADAVKEGLPQEDCVYFGEPDEKALQAERIYVGFWTDKENCDQVTAEFLQKLHDKEVFLFGSAGFGKDPTYFDKILDETKKNLDESVRVAGGWMCQGKMKMTVRERYEAMLKIPEKKELAQMLIENFDEALSHPNEKDFQNLQNAVKALN